MTTVDRSRPASATSRSARARAAGVVAEIAARRLADVVPELDALGRDGLRRAVAAAPAPRPIAEALAAPGLHLIAEVKRASPSAGAIAAADDAVARARAYARGGAAAISVLCEPHWFGGSIADLRAVRAAVSVPVLAKEFVVDPRQLDLLRAAGADLVLLLAVLHPPKRLARLVAAARDLGLEPLVEAHDEREIETALATGARLIGINNRNLRTLDVDPERAVRLRELVPGDRLAIAESGVRDPATIARWRVTGYDAALVGEALMRSADPAAAARAFAGAGRHPADLAGDARMPGVKVCGVTDAAGILAATRAGADAIGLNFAPGTPRELSIEEGVALARLARSAASAEGPRPKIVVVTADLPAEVLARVVAAVDPDEVQLNGDEPPSAIAAVGRPVWKALRVGAGARPDDVIATAHAYLDAGAGGILLDAAGGPHPGGTGMRVNTDLAAAVAREIPITLAGGLHPSNVGDAMLAVPAVGADAASGTEGPRAAGAASPQGPAAGRPVRQARPRRPSLPAQRALRAHARPPRAARGGRGRALGEGARLRRAVRARDAGRRPGAARVGLRRHPPRPAVLGGARRPPGALRRPAHRALPGGPARGGRDRRGPPPGRRRGPPDHRDPQLPPVPQARGPRAHRRPQDQQRAGPGAAHPAAGQDAGHRGDRCRPARRRHRHRLRPARAAVRRVHGRGGHPPPGPQRAPDAGPRRRGPQRDLRDGDAQGRRQRGDARLGHQRRDDPLRAGFRDGPAPVPHDRPRPPAPDR